MTHLKVLCTLWSTGSAWRINTTQCPLENCHLQQMDGAGCHQDPEKACPKNRGERNMFPAQPEAKGKYSGILLN